MNIIEIEKTDNGLIINLLDKNTFFDYYYKDNGFNSLTIGELLDDSRYLGNGWMDCTGMVGLTESPIIGNDVDMDDDGNLLNGEFYWFPNYQIECPFDKLYNEGFVFFIKS